MSKENNVLTYAIRDVDKIVWTSTVSSDGLSTVYTCNSYVYVPYGEFSNVIIGDSNIALTITKSAFKDTVLSQQIVNSVIFYKNTPINGVCITASTLKKNPIIKKNPNSNNKYTIFFPNETSIDGRADFIDSLGDFSNWAGTTVVQYKDNAKYITVTYSRYVGASPLSGVDTKIKELFQIVNFLDLEWVELKKTDLITTFEVTNVKLIIPGIDEKNVTFLIAELRKPKNSAIITPTPGEKEGNIYSLYLNAKFPDGNNGFGAYLEGNLKTIPFTFKKNKGKKTYKLDWSVLKPFGVGARNAFTSNYLQPLNKTATFVANLENKNLIVYEQLGVDLIVPIQ